MKQKILELIRRNVDPEITVTCQSRLREDLCLNSLTMMMLLWETEQLLGRELDLETLSNVKTVADILTAVQPEED